MTSLRLDASTPARPVLSDASDARPAAASRSPLPVAEPVSAAVRALGFDLGPNALDRVAHQLIAQVAAELGVAPEELITRAVAAAGSYAIAEVKAKPGVEIIQYGKIRFEVPVLQKAGFRLAPRPAELLPEVRNDPAFRHVGKVWDFANLRDVHLPKELFEIPDLPAYSRLELPSCLDMPIHLPHGDYVLPNDYAPLEPLMQRAIDFFHALHPGADGLMAYLTFHSSDLVPGQLQRRGGMHVDGFQGEERPEKVPIEFSIFGANIAPTVATTQAFDLSYLDPTRHNVFAEMDRINDPALEVKLKPGVAYAMDAYTGHRADASDVAGRRNFFRITWSVSKFDRLGLTDNPCLNYSWTRQPKTYQEQLIRYVPPINYEELPRIQNLASLNGESFATVGIGGGSDGLQARQSLELLSRSGKKPKFLISVRAKRDIFEPAEEIAEGVYRIDTRTLMKGRYYENRFADEVPTYIVMDDLLCDLHSRLQAVLDAEGSVDSMVFVDGGGNALTPTNETKADSRQIYDLRTLKAGAKLEGVDNKYSFIISPGVDTPPNADQLLRAMSAKKYVLTDGDSQAVLKGFARYGMSFEHPHTFAFIPQIWQQALRGEYGDQRFAPMNEGDPPYVVTPNGRDVLVIELNDHMRVVDGG
jgi:hypothetical protein